MLKKIHKSSHDLPYPTGNYSNECSMCSSRPGFYRCNSTHLICEKCHDTAGKTRCSQDSGDCLSEKKNENPALQLKNAHAMSVCAHAKDLASGDHRKPNLKRTAKSESKIKLGKDDDNRTKACPENIEEHVELETVLEYKNANFEDHKSSTSSLVSMGSQHDLEDVVELPETRICPRPVICPVQDCNKMIALDSVMLHFHFDHSKVPRVTLNELRGDILIKPSFLSTEARCLAVFLLQNKKQLCQQKTNSKTHPTAANSDCKSILLMGARLQMDKVKNRDEKIKTISSKNVTTQTAPTSNDIAKKMSNLTIKVKKSEPYKAVAQEEFDTNELLLLWLCKLDDCADVYNITLHKLKKLSYSYSGEAVHIREDQLPEQMYQNAESLILTGTAANKLLDRFKQISVVVNILE